MRPTTYVEIYRTTATLDPDEDQAMEIKSAAKVPASIRRSSVFTTIKGETIPRRVTVYAGRVRADVDVRVDDRLKDSSGVFYVVEEVNSTYSSVVAADKTLLLKRVS